MKVYTPRVTTEYVQKFLPDIYKNSKCKQIEILMEVENYLYEKISEEMEHQLQKWTLSTGMDETYAQKILDYINVTYVQNCTKFMLSKKTPTNIDRLHDLLCDFMDIQNKDDLSISDFTQLDKELNAIKYNIHIIYNANENDTKYDLFQKYKPFLETYLPYCLPPFCNLSITLRYHSTIEYYTDSMTTYTTDTIEELSKKILPKPEPKPEPTEEFENKIEEKEILENE